MRSPPPEEAKANPDEEERLRSLILSLEIESGILERVVYKNKNQHRRCPYFQALLKVRRDVRLLHSARLGEVLHHLFPVINGRKPAQKAYLPMRTKKNDPSGKHNYQDRLLGVARLLSQMAEPILKAAIQISLLLAKSFFTGFSVTILALLARLRVLAQQILLDVVSVFNKVSSLSQKKQSVKLTDEGIKAFREYYPSSKDVLTLECVWKEDKFVLLERTNNIIKNQDEDRGVLPPETPIQYETMELFSEARSTEDDFSSEKIQSDLGSSFNLSTPESVNLAASQECPTASLFLNPRADSLKKRVAFVSVKKPRPTDMSMEGPNKKMKLDPLVSDDATKIDDPYLNLLLGGSRKNDTLF